METKILVIAVVEKNGKILMRKKPEGSPPYRETWYLFGGALTTDVSVEDSIKNDLKLKAGIDIKLSKKLSWDTEVKNDVDGIRKFFVYLDVACSYVGGDLVPGDGVERLEWIAKDDLSNYDIVPPSRVLFRKLGYI